MRSLTVLLLLVFPLFSRGLEDRLGEMLMVGFHGIGTEEAWTQKIASQLKERKIGGVIFYGYNVKDPEQFKKLTAFLKSASKNALLALDEEGGTVERLTSAKGFEGFPTAGIVARDDTPQEAYALYLKMAKELKQYNINYNFAPVVDVNLNPNSPIIGSLGRSFGKTPETVIQYAKELIKAHDKAGVLTCLKHFPGHGSATGDTHKGLTDVTQVWQKEELMPFKKLIKQGFARSIMSAHILNQNIDTLPASLSKKTINILRKDLGYNGVVISDDLQMGAIAKEYSLKETVIKAINAGNDILLFSNYFNPQQDLPEQVLKIMQTALKDGTIKKTNIIRSLERIEKMKQFLKR